MANARTKPKPWMLKLAALAFSFVLLEGLLIALSAVSPQIRWLFNPIRSGFTEDTQRGRRGDPDHPQHDAWGYRNAEIPQRTDVVVIGDSQTYGVSVERDEAWPELYAKKTDRVVYNMGMPGAGPIQYHAAIDEALRLMPKQVVIVPYLANDLVDAYRYTYAEPVALALPDPARAARLQSLEKENSLIEAATLLFRRANGREPPGIYDLFVKHVVSEVKLLGLLAAIVRQSIAFVTPSVAETSAEGRWRKEKALAHTRREYVSVFDNGRVRTIFTAPYRAIAMNLDDPRIEEGLAITLRAIKGIQARCEQAGCQVTVLNFPSKELVFESEVGDLSEHVGLKDQLKHEKEAVHRLKQGAAKMGLRVLDALPPLRQALKNIDEPPYDSSPNGHPNRIGNRVIADYMASILQAN